MMKKIATSMTAVVFFVIGISGLMLYFHLYSMQVKALHENLGLLFILAALVHVVANWAGMKKYFTQKVFMGILAAALLVSGGFVVQSGVNQTDPKKAILAKVLNAPMESAFETLGLSYEEAIRKLETSHIKTEDAATITGLAKANQTSPFRIAGILLQPQEPSGTIH